MEQVIQRPAVDGFAADNTAVAPHSPLAGDAFGGEPVAQFTHGFDLPVLAEDRPDRFGLGLVDDELFVLHIVAQGRVAAHPHPLPLRGGDLVADAFARDLALELGEGEQDVQGQTPHRGGGVELLGDGDEGDRFSIKNLHKPGKIRQRPGQPVDLVDDDDVDPPNLDIGEQALQRRALQGGAGDAAIVVKGGQHDPALVLLARDIGLAGLPLRLQRVEVLLEAFFGGFAGVDGAAHRCGSPRPRWCSMLSHAPPPMRSRLKAAGRRSEDRTSARP